MESESAQSQEYATPDINTVPCKDSKLLTRLKFADNINLKQYGSNHRVPGHVLLFVILISLKLTLETSKFKDGQVHNKHSKWKRFKMPRSDRQKIVPAISISMPKGRNCCPLQPVTKQRNSLLKVSECCHSYGKGRTK